MCHKWSYHKYKGYGRRIIYSEINKVFSVSYQQTNCIKQKMHKKHLDYKDVINQLYHSFMTFD